MTFEADERESANGLGVVVLTRPKGRDFHGLKEWLGDSLSAEELAANADDGMVRLVTCTERPRPAPGCRTAVEWTVGPVRRVLMRAYEAGRRGSLGDVLATGPLAL